jgi:hypothetical protein
MLWDGDGREEVGEPSGKRALVLTVGLESFSAFRGSWFAGEYIGSNSGFELLGGFVALRSVLRRAVTEADRPLEVLR